MFASAQVHRTLDLYPLRRTISQSRQAERIATTAKVMKH